MKNRKLTLGMILTLLIIFLPLSIISTVLHKKYTTPIDENPKREFKLNGKLYFYENKNLLGTYECSDVDNYCDFAVTRNIKTYALDEFTPSGSVKTTLINHRYAFLNDVPITKLQDAEAILYDTETNQKLETYKEVKNYGVGIDGNYYIIKNSEDIWGVMEFNDNMNIKIPFKYDYIGLANNRAESGKIKSNVFVVLKNNTWKLIDIEEKDISKEFTEEIVTYDDEFIVLKANNLFSLVNYDGYDYFEENFKSVAFNKNFIEIIDLQNHFYLYDLRQNKKISNMYTIDSRDDVRLEIANNIVRIYVRNTLAENVELK